jgi:hypothetical protein
MGGKDILAKENACWCIGDDVYLLRRAGLL